MNDQLSAALFGASFGLFGALLGRPLFAFLLTRLFREPEPETVDSDTTPNISIILTSRDAPPPEEEPEPEIIEVIDPVYEGIHPDFASIPETDSPPVAENIDEFVGNTRKQLAYLRGGDANGAPNATYVGNLLCMLAGSIKEDGKRVVVFDYGGKTGMTFAHMLATAPWAEKELEYYVIEQDEFVDRMETEGLFQEYGCDNIHFVRSLADIPTTLSPDIVAFSSSLQAIENYREALVQARLLRPQHILITHTPMSMDVETFATQQIKFPPSPAKHWMLNFNEVVKHVTEIDNYELTYHTHFTSDVLTFKEFPPEYQDIRITNVMFSKVAP